MGIFNKENIKKVIKNPFLFVIIILLGLLALGQSFALGCLIGGLVAIPITLFGGNTSATISFFCSDSSWKMKSMNFLSTFLGKYTIPIIIISLVVWAFLKFTDPGKEIVSLLD
jgi:hypothetical protein